MEVGDEREIKDGFEVCVLKIVWSIMLFIYIIIYIWGISIESKFREG